MEYLTLNDDYVSSIGEVVEVFKPKKIQYTAQFASEKYGYWVGFLTSVRREIVEEKAREYTNATGKKTRVVKTEA